MCELKQAKTPLGHVALLQRRGMIVDEETALQWLANVSYYRLSAYWHPAWMRDSGGNRLDQFKAGTKFSDVVALYEADRKLRTLVHDGVERIEIAMRARLGELLCASHPLAYKSVWRFRPEFDRQNWLKTSERRVERARNRKDEHIEHYANKYAEKYPFWVLAEVLDFSDVSRLYAGLLFEHQREIAEGFGLVFTQDGLPKRVRKKLPKGHPLAGWLHQLSIVRNACAHHVRLWNKSFLPASTGAMRTLPVFAKLPAGQSERVFGALLVMAQLLRVASPGTSWPDKVANHICSSFLTNSLVNPRSMGLPLEWDGKL